MKILLAVDGSEYTRKMVDYVCSNRALFDPSHAYVVLHTQTPLPPHARSQLSKETVQGFHEDEAQKVLKAAVASLEGAGLKVTSQWKLGPAAETIAAFADAGKFDMLIMGSHGHGALARIVMGSVTNEVLARCGVPVLLIR